VVSPESPIGQAIMGAKLGAIIDFTNGERMFKVEIVSVN
jgi:transcription elongation GreA/GreB family factor